MPRKTTTKKPKRTTKPKSKPKPRKKPIKKESAEQYKTGSHQSPKCLKPFEYKSGWELEVAIILDQDPDVLCYSYEAVGIPYRSPNVKSTKIRRYFPDFFVSYVDGSRKIIEVKRDDRINNVWTQTKAKACIEWTEKAGIQFQIWGSKEITQAQFQLLGKQIQMKKKELEESKK